MSRRVLVAAVVALGLSLPIISARLPRVARAEECPFCHKEIDEGRGTYNCKACEETANEIARNAPQWTLEWKNEKPRRVTVKIDEGAPETFWWFPYTITNKDKAPHDFAVHIEAESDKGRNLAKYYDVAVPEVVQAIRKALAMKEGDPLYTQAELTSIPQGGANTQPALAAPPGGGSGKIALPVINPGDTFRCAAMFRAMDPEMDFLTIRVRGLSSDIEVEAVEQPFRRKMRERILELKYESPGDEFMTAVRPITFVSQKWIESEKIIKSDLR